MTTYKTAEAANPKPAVVFPTGIVPVTIKHKTVVMSLVNADGGSTLELFKVPAGAQILRWKVAIPQPGAGHANTTGALTVLQSTVNAAGTTVTNSVVLKAATSIASSATFEPAAAHTFTPCPYASGDGVAQLALTGGAAGSQFNADQVIEVICEYTLENSERFEMATGQ